MIIIIKNNLYYAFVHVHGWYSNLVNLLTIEDKLNVMRIEAWKLNELEGKKEELMYLNYVASSARQQFISFVVLTIEL